MKKTNLLLLILTVLSAAVFVNAQTVSAGPDFWVTDSTTTYDTLSLPANFFGPGSQAYSGTVAFKGDPASGNSYDTKITRTQDVNLGSGSGSTPLIVSELRLKSVSPITVTYNDGHTEEWDVYSSISSTQRSTGSMTISGNASGGTFSSNLNIIPKFNFVQVSGFGMVSEKGRNVKELDFGSPLVQKYLMEQARISNEKIRKGTGTQADEAIVSVCQVEPVEPVPVDPKTTTTTQTATTTPAPAPSCGIKLSGNGSWGWSSGKFCPLPLTELALLAKHGVIPWGCR